jgi:hypothetical protein
VAAILVGGLNSEMADWTTCNQTFVEWSLEGPLPKLCLVIPTSNQDGHQAKNRKKGMKFKRNLIEQMVSDKKIFMGISLRGLC